MAVTVAPFAELNVALGLHVKLVAPLADNTTGVPGQTVDVFGVTVKVKLPPIVTMAVAVPVQVPVAPRTV